MKSYGDLLGKVLHIRIEFVSADSINMEEEVKAEVIETGEKIEFIVSY